MDPIDKLIDGILTDKIDPSSLDDEQLELVLDRFYDAAEAMLDGPKHEAAEAILGVLEGLVDDRIQAVNMTCFEKSIAEAEARGSVYWEFDTYSIH